MHIVHICKSIWDPAKAQANLLKHGIRFSDAEGVLYDPMALTREDERSEGERRFVSIGMDNLARLVVVVFTTRGEWLDSSRRGARRRRNDTMMRKEYDFRGARQGAVVKQPGRRGSRSTSTTRFFKLFGRRPTRAAAVTRR